jgi:hypothetical protein
MYCKSGTVELDGNIAYVPQQVRTFFEFILISIKIFEF